jgi:hypothetical protein
MFPMMQVACSRCRRPVLDLSALFGVSKEEFLASCDIVVDCVDCQIDELIEDGAALHQARPVPGGLFPLDRIVVTPEAALQVTAAGIRVADLVGRHVCGDFGLDGQFGEIVVTPEEVMLGQLITDDEPKLAKVAVLSGMGTVYSRYTVDGQQVRVHTVQRPGNPPVTFVM